MPEKKKNIEIKEDYKKNEVIVNRKAKWKKE